MGCIVAVLGLAVPRVALVLVWIFTNRLDRAFDSFAVGFLGFLLLPTTTLFWALAHHAERGVRGFGWILVAFGLAMDLSAHGAGRRTLTERSRR
jgi:hypothetical protein